jgi:uncharacterized protein YraI
LLSGLVVAAFCVALALAVGQGRLFNVQAQGVDLPAAGVVTAEDARLNVRSEPGVGSAIVGKLDPGAAVQVLAVSDDGAWYQIEADGFSGWASVEFVSLGAAGSPSLPDADGSGAVSILARLGPPADTTASQGLLEQGQPAIAPPDEVEDEAETDSSEAPVDLLLPTPTPTPIVVAGQAELTAGDHDAGQTAEAAPAELVAAPTLPPAATPSTPTALVQPARMNVRAGPGTNYEIVSSVAGGTGLAITGKTGDSQWYRVTLPGGGDGWLFAQLAPAAGPVEGIPVLAQEELPAPPVVEAAAAQSAAPPVVAAPPPAGGGSFGYGVQAHLLGGGAGSALNAVNDMGFNWIKQQVEWRLFQSDPGAVGVGELGGIVSEAGNRGINVLFSVVNAPGWAREPGFDGSVGGPPQDPQTYASFVGGIAGQFCGTALKAIEVWNEQNLHYEWGNKPLDPAEYMNLLRAAYGAIKGACPSMMVISGALTPAGSNPPFAMDDFAYLEGMYQNGLANYADGIGAHPSGYNVPASVRWEDACGVIQQTGNSFNGACDTPHHSWSFRSTMEGYRNIMVVYGDTNKRIWPTEFGWAAGGAFDPRYAYANDNSFDEQAAWTVEAYTMMRDWGWVGPAFLWNLNFRVVADGTEKAQWGIVRNDYSPLPVYQALKAMGK